MPNNPEVTKSARRKEVVQTPSKSKAYVSTIEKRRKVIDAAPVNEPINVVEDTLGSEPNNDVAYKPPKAVQLKLHDKKFFVRYLTTHHVHMSCYTNTEIFKELKDTLTERQYRLFGKTYFGVFLQMPHCEVQAHILRCFMVRELNASIEDAFLMDINDSELRFIIRKFVIVNGLKCTGDLDDFKVA
ncbi:hypothetical protein RND71_032170 [Anisodus tanguticus]|uniref:Uncharacterized protein n=1 Tax=Anisodus tanguticus TaxID=243964 RepID=A0AAE1RC39_9SOLA|nr:hypothetical protein RND71_032170 [Anisodus tanguticus]